MEQSQSRTRPFRFRILILGKANAGKTTILKKICSETDVPIVRDRNGNDMAPPDSLTSTAERGMHDIDHEITYPSSPGFVFHDSEGLEAGSIAEADKIIKFVKRRATMEREQGLHAIWYCISGDDERPFGPTEAKFFKLDTRNVPVVVAFTKYDALELKALGELEREGFVDEIAERKMPGRAEQIFQEHFLARVMATSHPLLRTYVSKNSILQKEIASS